MGPCRAEGSAKNALRRAGWHPLGARRPRIRQAGLWSLPDPGGSEVFGDLGGVPAADGAAAHLPQRARRSLQHAAAAGAMAGDAAPTPACLAATGGGTGAKAGSCSKRTSGSPTTLANAEQPLIFRPVAPAKV